MSVRRNFEKELRELKEGIREIGNEVEKAYNRLFGAIEVKDKETILAVQENDRHINEMERKVESKCLFLIAKQQPVAPDLRLISSALKLVGDIERIGDHVADMADLILRLNFTDFKEYSQSLPVMIEETRSVLHDALELLESRDEKAAKEFYKRDDKVDELFNQVKMDVVNWLKKEQKDVDTCVDILMIAKYLERIGDHAINISEWELFRETGNIGTYRVF
ncbi:phosphate transport system regulatory protein PhoU [Blautia sp. An249]|uniref:phosphate signaling complex protein PhoU n=1 Tax=Blautia sp. An249 TaxID=1965603 RepID=UPI000B375A56|nr:phosphate signaling complex protein PhoU [Blautia sp. An249]OUO79953.1 phosphate transport system regulatory protein PhoU [Blautia sp. An249]